MMDSVEPMSYQRETALSFAVDYCSKTSIFSSDRVLEIAEQFLDWLTNTEGNLDY